MAPRTAADIRRSNLFQVLRRVFAGAPTSRHEIVAESGLSMATVASIVTELLGAGVLLEVAPATRSKGRPLTRLALDPAYGSFVGVDVAETYLHVARYDASLTEVASTRREVDGEVRTPEDLERHLTDLLAQVAADLSTVRAVGISVPGLVDDESGVSVYAPNWDWRGVPLRARLSGRWQLPVHLDNPLKALMVSELWHDPGAAEANWAVVNLGTGVGAAIAVAGELYRGASNSAGEWGHTTVAVDGRECRCGGTGCVEAYVGAPGLLAFIEQVAPGHPWTSLGETAAIQALAEGVVADDVVALGVVAAAGGYLGAGLANLVNTVNPERIVLAGWVSDLLGDALLEAARPGVEHQALARPLQTVTMTRLTRPGNAVAFGAATFALEASLSQAHTEGSR
jgi:predicted NBD/HSP70 family sugar kinase